MSSTLALAVAGEAGDSSRPPVWVGAKIRRISGGGGGYGDSVGHVETVGNVRFSELARRWVINGSYAHRFELVLPEVGQRIEVRESAPGGTVPPGTYTVTRMGCSDDGVANPSLRGCLFRARETTGGSWSWQWHFRKKDQFYFVEDKVAVSRVNQWPSVRDRIRLLGIPGDYHIPVHLWDAGKTHEVLETETGNNTFIIYEAQNDTTWYVSAEGNQWEIVTPATATKAQPPVDLSEYVLKSDVAKLALKFQDDLEYCDDIWTKYITPALGIEKPAKKRTVTIELDVDPEDFDSSDLDLSTRWSSSASINRINIISDVTERE